MHHTLHGAKRAARRLRAAMRADSIKCELATAQEVVARACGWRDWHHLQKTIGTDSAPSRPATTAQLAEYLDGRLDADAERVLRIALPEDAQPAEDHLEVMAQAGDAGTISAALKGVLMDCMPDAALDGVPPHRFEKHGIETIWFYAPDRTSFVQDPFAPDAPDADDLDDFEGDEVFEDEPRLGNPGRLGYSFTGASVRDIQWIMRDEAGRAIGAAFATQVIGEGTDWREFLDELDDSPMGDAEPLMIMMGGLEYYEEGRFLTINAIEIADGQRGRGLGTRLYARMMQDVRALSAPRAELQVVVEASERGNVRDPRQQRAFAAWMARPEILRMTREAMLTDEVIVFIEGRHDEGSSRRPAAASMARAQERESRGTDVPIGEGEWPFGRGREHVATGDFNPGDDLMVHLPTAYRAVSVTTAQVDHTEGDHRVRISGVTLTRADGKEDVLRERDILDADRNATTAAGIAAWNMAAAFGPHDAEYHERYHVLRGWSISRGEGAATRVVDDYTDAHIGYELNVALGRAGPERNEDSHRQALRRLARDIVDRGHLVDGVAQPWGDRAIPDKAIAPEHWGNAIAHHHAGDTFTFSSVLDDVDPQPDPDGRHVTWGERLDRIDETWRKEAVRLAAAVIHREAPRHHDPEDPIALLRRVPQLGRLWHRAMERRDPAGMDWIHPQATRAE